MERRKVVHTLRHSGGGPKTLGFFATGPADEDFERFRGGVGTDTDGDRDFESLVALCRFVERVMVLAWLIVDRVACGENGWFPTYTWPSLIALSPIALPCRLPSKLPDRPKLHVNLPAPCDLDIALIPSDMGSL